MEQLQCFLRTLMVTAIWTYWVQLKKQMKSLGGKIATLAIVGSNISLMTTSMVHIQYIQLM